jgi:hypothetical protein
MRFCIKGIAGGVVALASLALSPSLAAAQDCDRTCLGNLVTKYAEAVLAHDPSLLPLAEDAEYTEGGRALTMGEGAWQTITEQGSFRHDYLDTTRQVAASHIHFLEGDTPVLMSVALHVDDGEISGIETIVARITPDSPFQPAVLGEPIRGLDTPIPDGMRMSREDMIDIALSYAEGLRVGNFTDSNTPFAPEIYRVENGVITAGQGCFGSVCGLYDQRIMVHPGLIPSVVAVDEENGTVLLWMNFGYTDSYGPGNVLVTMEAFKIWGGSIHAVNAFFDFLPMGRSRGWPSEERVPRIY